MAASKEKGYLLFGLLPVTPVARLALAVGIGIHVLGFLLFRVFSYPTGEPRFELPWVTYLPSGAEASSDIIREQSELLDSTPLFMPTRWNTSVRHGIPVDASRDVPLFSTYPEIINLTDSSLRPANPVVKELDEGLGFSLSIENWNFFSGLGRASGSEKRAGLAPGLTVDIIDYFQPGHRWKKRIDLPEKFIDVDNFWAPVSFLVFISADGHAGFPLMLGSSGIEELDLALKQILIREDTLNALRSGYYRIFIGP